METEDQARAVALQEMKGVWRNTSPMPVEPEAAKRLPSAEKEERPDKWRRPTTKGYQGKGDPWGSWRNWEQSAGSKAGPPGPSHGAAPPGHGEIPGPSGRGREPTQSRLQFHARRRQCQRVEHPPTSSRSCTDVAGDLHEGQSDDVATRRAVLIGLVRGDALACL